MPQPNLQANDCMNDRSFIQKYHQVKEPDACQCLAGSSVRLRSESSLCYLYVQKVV